MYLFQIESLDVFYIWQSSFIRLTKNHSAPISAHHTSWKIDATYTFTLHLCRLMWRKDFLRRLFIQRSEQHLNKIDYLVLIFDNTAKSFFKSFCFIIFNDFFRNSNRAGEGFKSIIHHQTFACISSFIYCTEFEKKNNINILCTCHSRRWIFMTFS